MGILDAPAFATRPDSNGLPQFLNTPTLYGDSLIASKSTALQRWYYCLGLAQSGVGACDALFIGDSITTGYSVLVAQRWQALLAPLLRAKFQPSGIAGGRGYFSAQQAISTPSDYPSVVTNSAAVSNFDGLGAKCALLNASGHKVVYTTGNVTTAKLFYGRNSLTGSFSYKIDGGSSTTVTAGGTTSMFTPITFSGLGGTSHVIEVDWVSGSGGSGAYIDGVMEYNGDENAGLRFWDAGRSSYTSSLFLSNLNWFSDIATVQPALVMVMIGVNDIFQNPPVTAATLKANVLSIISKVKAQCTTPPSIVLGIEWPITPGGGVTPVDTWSNAISAMYQIAAADPTVCVFDARSRMQTSPTPNIAGGLLPDSTHPGQNGSIVFANALASFLSP